jgi:AraC family transcriptional regulator
MSISLRAERAKPIDLPRNDFQSWPGTAVRPNPSPRRPGGRRVSGQLHPIDGDSSGLASESTVGISPAWAVKRHSRAWDGMAAEIIQATKRQRIDIRFRAPVHLLVVGQRGERIAGETLVEGAPRSTLHDLAGRLTFVPAGHDYHDWQDPRILTRSIYFYFDPNRLKVGAGGLLREEMAPRLFFQNKTLLETAQKLGGLIERSDASEEVYLQALGAVLAHELVQLNDGTPTASPEVRGGLAGWQERALVEHIDTHLSENISITTLADIAGLSRFHFCRAFKQSFGMPPHRFFRARRIERAKELLEDPGYSITGVAMELGFSDSSRFSVQFRKMTGVTASAYRRICA